MKTVISITYIVITNFQQRDIYKANLLDKGMTSKNAQRRNDFSSLKQFLQCPLIEREGKNVDKQYDENNTLCI